VLDWWQKTLAGLPKKLRRLKSAIMMYRAWNIWKMWNWHIFDHHQLDVVHVFVRKMACGAPELSLLS